MITKLIAEQIDLFRTMALPIGAKVLFSIFCGGLIGLEREWRRKPAGVKTNILICLGSTLYTALSFLLIHSPTNQGLFGDPSRIAAQIVSGIGFIGAGTIITSKLSVVGVTTAATIWVVAAIGMCIGAGYPIVGFVFTLTVLFTLLVINRIEIFLFKQYGTHALEVSYRIIDKGIQEKLEQLLKKHHIKALSFDFYEKEGVGKLTLQFSSKTEVPPELLFQISRIEGIIGLKKPWKF